MTEDDNKDKIGNYDANKVEAEILEFWKKNNTYLNLKNRLKDNKPFYYLDGPPYTSGKIHIGHAWGKALRDAAMRYKRAKGFDVYDRAGFDMHGLPISHKVEAKLGIKGRDQIEAYGVEKFVKECKLLAIQNMDIMIDDFKRLGVWMDFENPYKPIDNSYIEGIWWLIKRAHENNRLYEGFRTLTWCASCETSVAKHELEYKDVTDSSIFVKFKVSQTENEYLIIWTTTPWTIPFNLAVMAKPSADYIKAKVNNEIWILAKNLASDLIKTHLGKEYEILDEFKGERLEGLKYIHPLKINFPEAKNNHTVVLSEEYVDTTSGTGLVHCAPGCGPEDYEVGHENGLEPFNKLTPQGIFEDMGELSGLKAKTDDKQFIKILEQHHALVHKMNIDHEYAHCWRCASPIVFRATKQWFFKVEDIKEDMKRINADINWVPDWAGSKQFHSWIDNLRDNSITKQIHWGTPFPVWKCNSCNDYKVIGSAKELKALAGKIPDDLHKPYIDSITIPCKCGKTMHRNPDVLDVWVDAGCSSWLCLDYPVREDLFNRYFPADFILEGKDQIRGWFNLLFVASMISMGKTSFKAVYMHGFINDSLGRKMSKSIGNVISPYEVIEKYGVDTLRYYTIGAANAGLDLNYNFDDMKIKNKNLVILWNLHKYLIDACDTTEINPSLIDANKIVFDIEEKYILSKLNSKIKKVTEAYDAYRLNEIPSMIEELFLDLSRTYIQLVREKLASGEESKKEEVIYSTYKVLFETLKMFSTIAPFISEKIYQNFKSAFALEKEDLTSYEWPEFDASLIDEALETDFLVAKEALQSILNAREKTNLGVRWPVKEVIIQTHDKDVSKSLENLKELLMIQANIKKIHLTENFKGLKKTIKPNYKALGPAFGRLAPQIVTKLAEESPETILKHIEKDGYKMKVGNEEVLIKKEHLTTETEVSDEYSYSEFKYGEVFLDITRTPSLDAEGYYREVSRRIQNLRKNAGLHKTDRIRMHLKTSISLNQDLKTFEKELSEKVGASELKIETADTKEKFEVNETEKIKEEEVKVSFSKI